jgi:hypothetical protein
MSFQMPGRQTAPNPAMMTPSDQRPTFGSGALTSLMGFIMCQFKLKVVDAQSGSQR